MNHTFTVPEIIAAVAATAALISLTIALYSARISRRSLRLNESESMARKGILKLYLINGFRFSTPSELHPHIIAFSLSVTNTAKEPNSIISIDLHVECVQSNGELVEYMLPHDETLAPLIKGRQLSPFSIPLALSPLGAESRWALFSDAKIIPPRIRRERYRVVVTDTRNEKSFADAIILGDASHE